MSRGKRMLQFTLLGSINTLEIESLRRAFPRQKRLRQNQIASEEARELCALNTSLRRQLKPYKTMARLARLRECFESWKRGEYIGATEDWIKAFHTKQAVIRHQLNDTAWRLRKQLQAAGSRQQTDGLCFTDMPRASLTGQVLATGAPG